LPSFFSPSPSSFWAPPPPEPGGGSAGKSGHAGSEAGAGAAGTGGAGTGGGAGGSAGGDSCGSCGEKRASSSCGTKFAACKQQPACKAIYDCVYGSAPGCALGAYGAKCMNTCVLQHCNGDQTAKLFLDAELCAYCDGACSLCSEYCAASTLTPDGVVCPQQPDPGDAAVDAETDAAADAELDAESDASVEAGPDAGDASGE
jgi:hypothetical protein